MPVIKKKKKAGDKIVVLMMGQQNLATFHVFIPEIFPAYCVLTLNSQLLEPEYKDELWKFGESC